MKRSLQKLISRGLDGELSPAERAQLERALAGDPSAAKTAGGWERIGDHLRGEAGRVAVPDAAVAWQDIRREIHRQEPEREAAAASLLTGRLRWAAAMASVCVVGLLAWSALRLTHREAVVADVNAPASRVAWVVAEVPGATTMIYTDRETDMTVIWLDVANHNDPRDT